MQQVFTKAMARNIFLGGAAFFLIIYLVLTYDTWQQIPVRDHADKMTPAVVAGRYLVDTNDCVGCHTINGEGAYFAPELDNVYKRRGAAFIKAWIRSQPTGVAGRRQMPHFNFSGQQLNDIVAYLKWLSNVDTNNWPPNIQG
ncbi:MAG TPA: cytochrome c [Gammaproteobacteria bacterium]|nr:cytochrome c [Gammaproteobacteria bacterium]